MPQQIDWQTAEIKPVIETDLGGLTLEYSRPDAGLHRRATKPTRGSTRPPETSNTSQRRNPIAYAVRRGAQQLYRKWTRSGSAARSTTKTGSMRYLMTGSTVNEEIDEWRVFNDMPTCD